MSILFRNEMDQGLPLNLGPAECLFQESYFSLMKSSLKPGGIVCSQAGTAWENLDHVTQTLQHCKAVFPVAAYGIVSVPTYPTGQIGFVLGSSSTVSTHSPENQQNIPPLIPYLSWSP